MKREFIEYGTYTFLYRKSPKGKISLIFSEFVLGLCASIMLIVSSIPFLVKTPCLWFFLLVLWGCMLICRSRENNQYMKSILIDGMFILYLAIFSSLILVEFQIEKADDHCALLLILASIVNLLIYEIVVLTKIKQKKYSYKKRTDFPREKKKTNNLIISIFSSLGAFIGVVLSRLTSKFIPFSIYQIIFVGGISLLWLCSFVLLQKYFILKALKYK